MRILLVRCGFSSEGKAIFWLDYTGLELGNFEEFESILQKVSEMSVVKITMRARPPVMEMMSENLEGKWEAFKGSIETKHGRIFKKYFDKNNGRILSKNSTKSCHQL